MTRFVPIPVEAFEALEPSAWVAVADLYKRAHALRWRPFQVTERSLKTRWGMGNSRVWSTLATLEELGLLTVSKGEGRRTPTTILVACPTSPPRQYGAQSGAQNEQGSKAQSGESAASSAAKVAALLLRHETEKELSRESRDSEKQGITEGNSHGDGVSPMGKAADIWDDDLFSVILRVLDRELDVLGRMTHEQRTDDFVRKVTRLVQIEGRQGLPYALKWAKTQPKYSDVARILRVITEQQP